MAEKKKRRVINPGDEIENAVFLEKRTISEKAVSHGWLCRCKLCGSGFFAYAGTYDDAARGCPKCRGSVRDELAQKDMINRWSPHIGERHGELLITGIHLAERKGGKYRAIAECHCDCGKDTNIPIIRILQGGAATCGHNRSAQLQKGHDTSRDMAVGGTLITAIDGKREKNKNNTSGHTGVSQMKNGYYRAYIYFRRKQYYLGCYTKIEDAIEARKIAEKNIYGSFLDWYASEYPEQWAQMQKHLKS